MINYGKFVKPSSRIWTSVPLSAGHLRCRRQSKFHYWASPIFILLFVSFFIPLENFSLIGFAQSANSLSPAVINEIAWTGTTVSANDEWVELYNRTENPANLDGWQLVAQDGTPKINLSGTIPANGFYLLERTDDNTIPGITADLIYKGALSNSGEILDLYDNFGNLIDSVNCSSGWFTGDNSTKQTMERKDGIRPRSGPENWQTSQNTGGTPRAQNSLVAQIESKEEEKPSPKEKLIEAKPQQPITPGSANVIPAQETEGTEVLEEAGKIDINTALLKDLVKIVHIGEIRAKELISLRPFYSLDDLTRIKGIGDKALEDIKKQGLAWVDPKLERPKVEKTEPLEKGLAAVAEPLKPLDQDKQIPKSLFVFLIALVLAIFSGVIILILKKQLKNFDLSKKLE